MFSRPLTLAILGFPLLFGGCTSPKPLNADYAKRAYLKQQKELSAPLPSENRIEGALLNLQADRRAQWEKQDYETLDAWIQRLEEELKNNKQNLDIVQSEFESNTVKENSISNSIKGFIDRNNSMTATLQDHLLKDSKGLKFAQLIPPFSVYLVRKGDTLYSIAQKFYKSSSAIADIMDWNRGWIRYPNQIQAGIPLVLYSSLSTKKGNVQVFNFIHHLDELREEELALSGKK